MLIAPFCSPPNYCEHYVKQLHPNLTSLPLPVEEEFKQKLLIPFTLIWHKRNAYNPKITWLRDSIKQLSMRNHT